MVFNIWDLNSQDILSKVKNVLNQWHKRKLTLIGRITVIKSIALSKFVHLFISLPEPPNELLKELEILFYKFLWNAGPDRIKRKVIIKNISCAGLRMIELKSFIKALKISWLRRIIQQSNEDGSKQLSYIHFVKLYSFGGCYAAKLMHELQNPFWKNLMHIWFEFCKIVPVENIAYVVESPIWYNSHIGHGRLFLKNLSDNGIRVIYDIIGDDGEFYTFEELKAIFNIRGTFLDYQHIINSIPQTWKTLINNNRIFLIENRYNTICNIYVRQLIKVKKGSRVFYDMFVNVKEFVQQNKWQVEMGNIGEKEWQNYFSTIQRLNEVKLRDFQYKINNKILVTNSFLFKINKIDNEMCSYCQEQPEKNHHLFLRCPKIRTFHTDLQSWLKSAINIEISLSEREILFAYNGKKDLENYIYVLSKYFIYQNKFFTKKVTVQGFANFLKKKMLSGKYMSHIYNRIGSFFKKMGHCI